MHLATEGFDEIEYVQIKGDRISPSLLLWRRYKRPYPKMLAIFLDINPELAEDLMQSPFIPVGRFVRLPIDHSLLHGRPKIGRQVTLSGVFG